MAVNKALVQCYLYFKGKLEDYLNKGKFTIELFDISNIPHIYVRTALIPFLIPIIYFAVDLLC